MSKQLPPRPNLRNLKNQAKSLLKSVQAGDLDAIRRIQASLPRLSGSSEAEILEANVSLREVQHVITVGATQMQPGVKPEKVEVAVRQAAM